MSYPEMFTIVSICKGGRYHYCRTDPPHPKANTNGLYPLHRVVAENSLGRLLRPNEVVHHRDGDKLNDDEQNLEVMDRAEHARLHARTVEVVSLSCAVCGGEFKLKPAAARLRSKRKFGRPLCCSRRCGTLQAQAL